MAILLNRLLPADPFSPRTGLDSDEAVLEACRASVQRARSLGFVPARLRDDIALLHAVCRLLDDSVSASDGLSPRSELARLEAELMGEVPGRPVVRLARARLPRIGIDPGLFRFLIAGVGRELDPSPIREDDELLCYGYCVAGIVSVMLGTALGIKRSRALPYAIDLAIGLQLTSIARDCLTDAARGRCYVPVRRLAPHELTPQRLIQEWEDPEVRQRLRPVLEGLLRLGDHYYRSAEAGAAEFPWRYRHGLLFLGRVYRREGWRAVQGRGARPDRVMVPVWEQALLLSQVAGLSLTPRVVGLGPRPPHDWRLHSAFAGNPGTDPVAAGPEPPGTPSMTSRLPWRRRGTGPVRRTW